ncbi:hypothetical protein [Bacteroides sp.]
MTFVAVIKNIIRCIAVTISSVSLSAIKRKLYPSGESISSFYDRNKVPYNLFEKWYKDTRHKLVPVQVDGRPSAGQSVLEESPSEQKVVAESVRILVDICMSNGIHIQQRNLDFEGLKRLVGNLEVLC